jgi:hypothetical protein
VTLSAYDTRVFKFAMELLVHDPSNKDAHLVVENFRQFLETGMDSAMSFCEFMAPLNPTTMVEVAEQNARCDAYLRIKRQMEER